jgi:hypothetical protein
MTDAAARDGGQGRKERKSLIFFLTVSFTLFIVRLYELRTEKYF